ncbi:hypothetical protein KIN20_005586 [Parelaphostrongylus tenuis]|uniref:Uncharacterized protein n=1 Tax=Parelaphostrongylus tenuis TaxID=148309 RepID=A0AAD5MLQ1_PARTN|nr:hypothetical protein KIN20_005586 [Parelaphostrongylus tenuis]
MGRAPPPVLSGSQHNTLGAPQPSYREIEGGLLNQCPAAFKKIKKTTLALEFSPLYYAYEASTEGSLQQTTAAFLNLLVKKGFKGTIPSIMSVARRLRISEEGTTVCVSCEYPFSGNGGLCYTCSAIAKDLPSSSIFHMYSNN